MRIKLNKKTESCSIHVKDLGYNYQIEIYLYDDDIKTPYINTSKQFEYSNNFNIIDILSTFCIPCENSEKIDKDTLIKYLSTINYISLKSSKRFFVDFYGNKHIFKSVEDLNDIALAQQNDNNTNP